MALWQQAIREAYAGRDDGEVARLTGLSQPWVNQIRNGRIPSRPTLVSLVNVLGVDRDLRSRIFLMAGYVDPAEAATARLMAGMERIVHEAGRAVELSLEELQQPRATEDDVEKTLQGLRRKLLQ